MISNIQFSTVQALELLHNTICWQKGKGKVLPYSLPSVGLGADPGVQAVSLQVIFCGPLFQFKNLPSFNQYKVILLNDRDTYVWRTCPRLLRSFVPVEIEPATLIARSTPYRYTTVLPIGTNIMSFDKKWIFYGMFNKLRKSLRCVRLRCVTYCWKSGVMLPSIFLNNTFRRNNTRINRSSLPECRSLRG